MQKIIKVEAFDELASLIDKVLTCEEDIIFLEIADDAYIAQNVLNFRLLKREVDSVGKSVIVVSSNKRIRNLASKASLRTRDALPASNVNGSINESVRQSGELREKPSFSRRTVTDIVAPDQFRYPDSESESRENKFEDIKISSSGNSKFKLSKKKLNDEDKNLLKLLRRKKDSAPSMVQELAPKVNTYNPESENSEIVYKRFSRLGGSAFGGKKDKKEKEKKFQRKEGEGIIIKLRSFLDNLKSNPKKSVLVAVISLVLGTFGYILIFVLPSATITLYPKSIQDTITIRMLFDSNVAFADLSKNIIPAQVLEERRENNFNFEATGEAEIEQRAGGRIKVFNEFSSASQTLVANTRFLSSNGKLFRTKQTILIPGALISGGKIVASSIFVDVIAAEAGSDFNIGSSAFSIPGFQGTDKYLAFYGKSEEPMSGGFRGKTKVVTQEDIDKAKEQILDEFLKDIEETLRSKIPEDLFLIEETFDSRFETVEIDVVPQDAKENFSIRVIALARTFLIKESDLLDSLDYYFVNSTEYSKNYELSEERSIIYKVKEIDYDKGYAKVDTEIKQIFNRSFDADSLYGEIRGRGEIELRKILTSKDELERIQVRFWPFWVRTVPDDMDRIEIKVEYQAELQE